MPPRITRSGGNDVAGCHSVTCNNPCTVNPENLTSKIFNVSLLGFILTSINVNVLQYNKIYSRVKKKRFRFVELPFPYETPFIYHWNSFHLESLPYMRSREGRNSRDANASL